MDFGSPFPSGNLDENRLDYGAENVENISLNWDQAPQPVSGNLRKKKKKSTTYINNKILQLK